MRGLFGREWSETVLRLTAARSHGAYDLRAHDLGTPEVCEQVRTLAGLRGRQVGALFMVLAWVPGVAR